MNRLRIFLATAIITALSAAQSAATENNNSFDYDSAPNEKWYQIEIIVFSQVDVYGDENAPLKLLLKYPGNLITFPTKTRSSDPSDVPGARSDNVASNLVEWSEKQLNAYAYSLNSTGVYKVLFHQSWQQIGLPHNKAPWILVQGGSVVGDHHQLEGSVRVSLDDYLYFDTNLWLIDRNTSFTGAENEANTFGANVAPGVADRILTTEVLPTLPNSRDRSAPLSTAGATPMKIGRVDSLLHSERVLLGNIHYIDHPRMGILIKIIRAKRGARRPPLATAEGVE